jgi:multidrug resistance efflux pump
MELRATAEDTSKLEVTAAELDQKRMDLKKLESAHAKGAVTKWELEHTKLDVQIAELALKAAKLEHEQDRRRLEQAVSQIERMRLVSPVSGRVEKVLATAGESVKALDPVIQLISIDPLWIDTPVPVDQIRGFTKGQRIPVQFPTGQSNKNVTGRIIHISSVVDAASETMQVRLEVPNPKGRPAGERIIVRIGEDKPQKQHTKNQPRKDLTITPPVNYKMQRP